MKLQFDNGVEMLINATDKSILQYNIMRYHNITVQSRLMISQYKITDLSIFYRIVQKLYINNIFNRIS